MIVTVNDVNEIFTKLINSEITRENADCWAYEKMEAFDSKELEFQPIADHEKIWDAIQYLYGIDTKLSPKEYMHSIDEVEQAFKERWNITN